MSHVLQERTEYKLNISWSPSNTIAQAHQSSVTKHFSITKTAFFLFPTNTLVEGFFPNHQSWSVTTRIQLQPISISSVQALVKDRDENLITTTKSNSHNKTCLDGIEVPDVTT